jgi:HK97 family phage major capsid protein
MAPAAAAREELQRAFEAFKDANDERLKAIERGRADPLLEDKVDRIDRALVEQKAAIERLSLSLRRPALAPEERQPTEQKAAWGAFLRKGDEAGLARFEAKALSVGTGSEGGFVAPAELDRMIEMRLRQSSPMRTIASVVTTSASTFKRPISIAQAGSGWAAEKGERTTTDSPVLYLLEYPTAELYANLAATQQLLDDAFVNVDEWIASEVEQAFAAQERAAFVTGDGTNKPRGFLASETVADASHAWGKLGFVASGGAGAFAASAPVDRLLDLVYAPKAEYRQNARFVMNRRTLSAVRKHKDANNAYIWRPNDTDAGSAILGYPVTELEDMPNIAADAFAIAFGDFARGYLIVDRAGVRVLRDPYTAKPYVLFYVTKRVGGGVQNFDAIKLMKFAA